MGKFDGRWRIVWMEEWDSDYIDMEEPGHFLIDGSRGHFVFGTVRGDLDARLASGSDRLEFSWEGQSEGDDINGRGWLVMTGTRKAEGRLFIHLGDDSGIRLEKT